MSGRDLGASVRQRLLNQARSQGRPFQELLQYFAMERFLYRLAKSPFADRFILRLLRRIHSHGNLVDRNDVDPGAE
jgi:hypothetical protein